MRCLLVALLLVLASPAPARDLAAIDGELRTALRAGELATAEALARERLARVERQHPDPHQERLVAHSYLGIVLRGQGRLGGAQAAFAAALAQARELHGDDALATATARSNLAGVLRERGELRAAEEAWREVLLVRERRLAPRHRTLAATYNNLGSLLLEQGDAAAAEPMLREVLGSAVEQGRDEVVARQNLADALAQLGRPDEAAAQLDSATAVLDGEGDAATGRRAGLARQRARLAEATDDFARAREAWEHALALSPSPHARFAARLGLARHCLATGDLAGAAGALAGADGGLYGDEHPRTVEWQSAQGALELRQGRTTAAIATLRRARGGYGPARLRGASGLRRATRPLGDPAPLLAAALLRDGQAGLTWSVAAEAQGRLAREWLGQGRPLDEPDSTRHLRGRLLDAEREVEAGGDSRALARLRALQLRWARQPSARSAPPAPVDAARVARALAPADRLLLWLEPDPRLLPGHRALAVLGPGGEPRWFGLPDARPGPEVALSRELAGEGGSALGLVDGPGLRERRRARTVEHLGGAEAGLPATGRLLCVGAAPARGAPAAWVDAAGEPLLRRFSLALLPAVELLGDTAPPPTARGLLLADPAYGPAVPRLPAGATEWSALDPLLPPGPRLRARDATPGRLREALAAAGGSVVHLATHALIDPVQPGRSALLLAPGPGGEDRLELRDLLAAARLQGSFVALTGCSTAGGRAVPGEGQVGFAQALLGTGASSMLLNLWPADDEAAAQLAAHFYRGWLRQGLAPDEALRRAQLALLAEPSTAHPHYWAGAILIGRPGSLDE